MALRGNPFLGKLKVPAPDLSHIPETPFENTVANLTSESASAKDLETTSDRVQTGSEIGFKRVQTGSEIGFKRVQKHSKQASLEGLNPIEPVSDRVQTGSETGSETIFKQIPYGELAVLRYFADREVGAGTPIYARRREIASGTSQTINGVKTALRRLRETGLIQLNEYQRGPNRGITSYRLTQKSHQILASKFAISRLGFNRVQTGSETGSNGFSSSSSSLDLDLNKLTNTGVPDLPGDLPTEWNEIDPSPLGAIRFGRHHLAQLVRVGNLTADQVQESINAFAFDLEVNGKGREINGHALNYFMGILRKGPYAPSANYEPPEVRQMRLYLDAKDRERKVREELESRLETAEFDSWAANLSVEDRSRFVPPTDFAKPGSPGHNVQLKQYFRENVWPEGRGRVLRGEV